MEKIPYVNLPKQWAMDRDELLPILEAVFNSGNYIGGDQVVNFEESAAALCNTRFAVALNSGTDALIYGMLAMGIGKGDEVITPPNSFIASTAAIVHIGAVPVFVDVCDDQNIDPEKIEKAITKKTKAIMPVHLTGRVAAMKEILEISEKHSLTIVEDAAQSIGSKLYDKPSGSFGRIAGFSAHPLKNLNAAGDAGFLTTNDEKIYENICKVRNHGLIDRNTVEIFGVVSRMDALQAAILNYRLKKLPELMEARRTNAKLYQQLLNKEHVFFPEDKPEEFNTYHTFVIQVNRRDELKEYLLSKGIETSIHYPIPIHLQPASKSLGYKLGDFPKVEAQASRILTLPINQFLKQDQIEYISATVNEFYSK
ncbi:DegT/DnrJ/EryC1/StrS family aminotransferase [Leptospira limi]|uniref:DegT/DnrJ/EryC1/StrS family aminotransferase n=1 Tax=Leptospira limi TaxID=2950023 RepID=A0ABT3LZ50_9LEPT|nr:DegT/DnrJ/EryC1/StrS family aminotransferase [Leptospira limi]MCW7462997.1 DegT/DnrJ/EryC1/StrS family aminotransferase [Leptospira limi]